MHAEGPIKTIVDNVIANTEFKLVALEVKPIHRRTVIRVFLDSEHGITIDQCKDFSRAIEEKIDGDNLFSEYALEVSSPGLDRPIQFDWQYRKNIGRNLKITFADDHEVVSEFTGTLERVDSGMIYLKRTGQKKNVSEALCIPIGKITGARIQLKW